MILLFVMAVLSPSCLHRHPCAIYTKLSQVNTCICNLAATLFTCLLVSRKPDNLLVQLLLSPS